MIFSLLTLGLFINSRPQRNYFFRMFKHPVLINTGSYLNIHPHYYSPEKLREYTGETITIVLNPGQGVRESGWRWLSMYCILATQNFGHVVIPENVNVIPYIDVSQFAFNFSLLISTLITGLHT